MRWVSLALCCAVLCCDSATVVAHRSRLPVACAARDFLFVPSEYPRLQRRLFLQSGLTLRDGGGPFVAYPVSALLVQSPSRAILARMPLSGDRADTYLGCRWFFRFSVGLAGERGSRRTGRQGRAVLEEVVCRGDVLQGMTRSAVRRLSSIRLVGSSFRITQEAA